MATTPTPPARPEPERDTNDVGIFVTNIPIGVITPSSETRLRIMTALGTLNQATPRAILKDLLTIKMLAPVESADLVVCNVPMAQDFIRRLKADLVMKYYMER